MIYEQGSSTGMSPLTSLPTARRVDLHLTARPTLLVASPDVDHENSYIHEHSLCLEEDYRQKEGRYDF